MKYLPHPHPEGHKGTVIEIPSKEYYRQTDAQGKHEPEGYNNYSTIFDTRDDGKDKRNCSRKLKAFLKETCILWYEV